MTGEKRGGGAKVCIPKMAQSDSPNGKLYFFRRSLWSRGGGGYPPPPAVHGHSNTALRGGGGCRALMKGCAGSAIFGDLSTTGAASKGPVQWGAMRSARAVRRYGRLQGCGDVCGSGAVHVWGRLCRAEGSAGTVLWRCAHEDSVAAVQSSAVPRGLNHPKTKNRGYSRHAERHCTPCLGNLRSPRGTYRHKMLPPPPHQQTPSMGWGAV